MSADARTAAFARQQELLRRARAGAPRRARPAATAASEHAEHAEAPLSHAQRRMWLMDRLGGGDASYHVPFATRVRGPFDPAALAGALDRLVDRHAILRTRYAQRDGEPFQEVLPAPAAIAVPVVDVDEAGALALVEEEAGRPFDLAAGRVVRALVLRHGPRDHTVMLTFHHIAVDGASLETVARELAEFYAEATGAPAAPPRTAPPQYADHARREQDEAEGRREELGHWAGLLTGAEPPRLPGPTEPVPHAADRSAGVHTVPLAPRLPGALRALGAERRATLFAVSLAAAFAALRGLTGDDDLVIGVAGTHRQGTDMRELVGLCVNTLPVRVDTSGDPAFAELVERVRNALTEAQRFRHIPFDLVLERLGAGARGADGTALVRVTADVIGSPTVLRLPGTTAEYVDVTGAGAKFALSYGLVDSDRPAALVQYDRTALDDVVAAGTAAHYAALLDAAVGDPDLPLSRLPQPADGMHGRGTGSRTAPDPAVEAPVEAAPDPHPAVAALRADPRVADATVVAPAGGPALAYAVLRDSVGPTPYELLVGLRAALAAEDAPGAVTLLDTLPLRADGTVDTARLPGAPDPGAPGGPIAEAVVEGFGALLGHLPSPDDDFFALGGHSLVAVQLAERLRTALQLPLTGLDVLKARTPRAVTALLDSRRAEQATARATSAPARRGRTRPGTVLVTGATGGVGAFVLRELAAQGRPVLALARPESAHLVAVEGVDVVEGDLTDLAGLGRAVADADAVIHAACTFTRPDVDVAAMKAMTDAWRRGPFVFVSSVDAYGHPADDRVAEESASGAPVSPYGQAKLDCEALLLGAAGTGGRGGASAVRSPIVWGAHDRLRDQLRHGAIGSLYQAAREGRPIGLPRPGTGGHAWYGAPWVHAAALARAVTACLDLPVHGVANACSGHVSWRDLAEDLTELLGSDSEIHETDRVHPDLDHHWHYDCGRLAGPLRPRPGEDRRTVLTAMVEDTSGGSA
ncbi:condensation domain-containing protein [Streptomyces sp. NPDC002004]